VRLARLTLAAAVVLIALVAAGNALAAPKTTTLVSSGTIAVPNEPAPSAGPQGTDELRPGTIDVDSPKSDARGVKLEAPAAGPSGTTGTAPDPTLATSFNGLNFFQQRFSNNGNQFSIEPPDQGLCVGNNKVVEIVNDVYRVYDMRGRPLINPVAMNHLFGYSDEINRTTGVIGEDVFDPSCIYDSATNTFFIIASALDVSADGSGADTGTSHIDILVGKNPTGTLTKFSIDTTRDAPCFNDARRTQSGPCFPDYPHIGADANGIYITTNVFDFFGPAYEGVNLYALPKAELAASPFSVPVTLLNTEITNAAAPAPEGQLFSAIPAVSPATQFASASGGTEYLASSRAVFTDGGTSSSLVVETLANTSSLTTSRPSLQLTTAAVDVRPYAVPAAPTQKPGSVPLATCVGSQEEIPATGVPCWQAVDLFNGRAHVTENVLDGNDSRVGGVSFANGQLWVTLGTAATAAGQAVDGAAWYILDPAAGSVVNQGTLTKAGANLTYPSIAATTSGAAALSFTIVGPNDYPSSGYAGLNAADGTSNVLYAAHGVGPEDGFTEYEPFFQNQTPRPRWGDYGAAVANGTSIWAASEYIGQTCTFDQYLQPSPTDKAAFGTCGDTRGALGNWYTSISQLTP
jgi:hypothetical protein